MNGTDERDGDTALGDSEVTTKRGFSFPAMYSAFTPTRRERDQLFLVRPGEILVHTGGSIARGEQLGRFPH